MRVSLLTFCNACAALHLIVQLETEVVQATAVRNHSSLGIPAAMRAAFLEPYSFFSLHTTTIDFLTDYISFVARSSFNGINKRGEVQKLALTGGTGPRIPVTFRTLARIVNAICRHFKSTSIADLANSMLKMLDVGTGIGIPYSVLCTLGTVYGAEMDAEAAAIVGQLCRNRDRVFIGEPKCKPRTEANLLHSPHSLPFRMDSPSITVVDVTKKTFTGTIRPTTIHVILNLTAARFEVHVCGALVLLTMKTFPHTGVLLFCELQHGRDVDKFKTAGLLDEGMGNLLHVEGKVPGGDPFHLSIPIGTSSRTLIGFVVREPQRARFASYCSNNRDMLPPDFDCGFLPALNLEPETKQVGQGLFIRVIVV